MKILLVDQTATALKEQIKAVALSRVPGVELTVLAPSRWVENYQPLVLERREDAEYTLVGSKIIFPGYGNRAFYVDFQLPRVLRRFKPDVTVMLVEPYSAFALQVVIAKEIFAKNSRVVFYTFDDWSFNHRYHYRPAIFYKLVAGLVLARADCAVVANETCRAVLLSKGFQKPIHSVYWGINGELFRPGDGKGIRERLGFARDAKVVGFVGRLVKSKGVDTLIEAIAGMDSSVRLLLVGEGPHRAWLQHLVREKNLDSRVVFTGYVSPEHLPEYYSAMDVSVLPSRTVPNWTEQYGRTLAESMACGVLVIGSDSGAIPEVIGDAGLIFHEGDARGLQANLQTVLQNPGLRANLVARGRQRFEQRFSCEVFAKRMYEICREVSEAKLR
jgi:glycosyltransferase involved in cell wall biosynthesis